MSPSRPPEDSPIVEAVEEDDEAEPEEAAEPVLTRIVFKAGTSMSAVADLVNAFPWDTLRKDWYPSTENAESGLRLLFMLLFRRPADDSDQTLLDGGLSFTWNGPRDASSGPSLDVARISEGCPPGTLPKVIREKQAMKKVREYLQESEAYSSSAMRAFGSGSF